MSVLGSNDGYEATASRLPVLTSMMTTVPGRRLGLLDPLRQGVLGVPLQARVDREGDVVAVDRRHERLSRPTGMIVPSRPCSKVCLPGRAVEVLLHHQLDPAAGLAVAGHVADERGRRRALRVGALGAGLAPVAVDARDPELGDRVPRQRRDVAAEDAVAAGAGELAARSSETVVSSSGASSVAACCTAAAERGGVARVLAGAVGAHGLLVGDDDLAHDARGEHGAVGGRAPGRASRG